MDSLRLDWPNFSPKKIAKDTVFGFGGAVISKPRATNSDFEPFANWISAEYQVKELENIFSPNPGKIEKTQLVTNVPEDRKRKIAAEKVEEVVSKKIKEEIKKQNPLKTIFDL